MATSKASGLALGLLAFNKSFRIYASSSLDFTSFSLANTYALFALFLILASNNLPFPTSFLFSVKSIAHASGCSTGVSSGIAAGSLGFTIGSADLAGDLGVTGWAVCTGLSGENFRASRFRGGVGVFDLYLETGAGSADT